MANKKKPYAQFETKEDFDKELNRMYREGRAKGFKEGSIWVLSYVQELFKDLFKPEAFEEAEDEIRHRNIEKWRRKEDVRTLKEKLDFEKFINDTIKSFDKLDGEA